MEDDDDLPRSVVARLKDLECEEDRLVQEMSNLPEQTVVRLPANYEALYRVAIAELEQHLATREASASRNAIRTLVDAVLVHAGDSRGGKHRRLELQGDLFSMFKSQRPLLKAVSRSGKNAKSPSANAGAFSGVLYGCGSRI